MRAILLAGGHATRLWPITRNRAKPLLPIGDTTLVERLIDQLTPAASEVLVSTNELFADQFAPVVRDREGVSLVVESQTSEAQKPGALGAILQLVEEQELPADEPLLVAGGDNYYGFDLAPFAEAAGKLDGPTVAVKDLANPALASQFGIVELGNGSRIARFHEKPEDPPSTLAATALYHYPAGWNELFDTYEAAALEAEDTAAMLDAPGRILEWAVAQDRQVHAWSFQEPWHDIGTAEGYLEALDDILDGRYVEGTIQGCQEGRGVYVFGDAMATDSTLERTILLPGARVQGCSLDGCIVDAKSSLEGVALEDSLVGGHSVLHSPTD